MTLTLIVLFYFLAVMRITRLVNYDTIMDWLHNWVGSKFGPGSRSAEFLMCPWCVGMWVALLTAWAPLLYVAWPGALNYVVIYLMLALAASMVTGLLARFSSEDVVLMPRD